jgi:hypothetical protein
MWVRERQARQFKTRDSRVTNMRQSKGRDDNAREGAARHGKGQGFRSIPEYSGIFRSIPTYSGVFRNIPEYSGVFRSIPKYSGLSRRANTSSLKSGGSPINILDSRCTNTEFNLIPSELRLQCVWSFVFKQC